MEQPAAQKNRNYGIDLLRVLLGITVVVLHLLHYGGPRTHTSGMDPRYFPLWLVGIALDCTVNCFAILSGYVSYDRPWRIRNLLRLHLTVVYHSVFLTCILNLLYPGNVVRMDFLRAFFPLSNQIFWYYSAYAGLYFLKPILNEGMKALNKKQADLLVVVLMVLYSVMPTLSGADTFTIRQGYSVLWLIILYVIGTYLKKYRAHFSGKRRLHLFAYLGSILATCLLLAGSLVFPGIDFTAAMEYCSPTILIAAIALVLLFSEVRVSGPVHRVVSFFVPLTFGVYLIHEFPLFRQLMVTDSVLFIHQKGPALQVILLITAALVLWLACAGMDFIRNCIFSLFQVNQKLERVESRLMALFAGDSGKEPQE